MNSGTTILLSKGVFPEELGQRLGKDVDGRVIRRE
jgi:hypothetical protein